MGGGYGSKAQVRSVAYHLFAVTRLLSVWTQVEGTLMPQEAPGPSTGTVRFRPKSPGTRQRSLGDARRAQENVSVTACQARHRRAESGGRLVESTDNQRSGRRELDGAYKIASTLPPKRPESSS
jgi:hypothetical protein